MSQLKEIENNIINSFRLAKNDILMGYKTIVDEYLTPIIINSNDYIVKSAYARMSDDNFKMYTVELDDLNHGFTNYIYIVSICSIYNRP